MICRCGAEVHTERVMRSSRWVYKRVESSGVEHWCPRPAVTDEDRTRWQREWREQFPRFSAVGSWERLLERDARRATNVTPIRRTDDLGVHER